MVSNLFGEFPLSINQSVTYVHVGVTCSKNEQVSVCREFLQYGKCAISSPVFVKALPNPKVCFEESKVSCFVLTHTHSTYQPCRASSALLGD